MNRSSQMKLVGGACALGAIVIALFLSLLMATPAYAVTAAEKQAEAQEALNELNNMQQTLDEASARYFDSLEQYRLAKEQCDKAQARIDELSKEIAEVQGRLGNRAREMYRNGSTSFLDLLLGATSFDEFANNWDLLTRLNVNDADMSAKARELRAQTEEQKAIYTEQSKIAEQKSEEAGRAFEEAEVLVEQMQAKYDSLSEEALELMAQEQAAAQAAAMASMPAEGGWQNDDGTVTDIATGQVYSSPAEYSAATGNAIVDRAMAMLGSSYVWGGVGGSYGGFDCSGFVSYALTGQNTRLGTTATFNGWNEVSDPQPGDVCVIHEENGSQHTGIYLGDGMMIDAHNTESGVSINPVQDGMKFVRQG